MKLTRILFAAALAALALPLSAQQGGTNNMDILRDKLKGDRKVIVASNMKLSESEGKNFWPIYDAYQTELRGLNDKMVKLIQDYADVYNKGKASNEAARDLIHRSLAIDMEETSLRKTYVGKMQHAGVSDVQVARWAQIENKIRAAVRYDLASSIPLVE